jgi:DNA-directed RNA polymerase, mitochondrial
MKLAVGDKMTINEYDAARAIAANVVHSCDAAHMHLTAWEAAKRGIQIAGVHDAFGCLAPQMDSLQEIIRRTFFQMHTEHDALAEVLAQARADLPAKARGKLSGLSPPRERENPLNLEDVLKSAYAWA